MPWARIDDSFHDNAKVVDLLEEADGCAAVGLWLVCLTWAHRHTRRKPPELRGFVPHSMPRKLIGQGWSPLADLLCKHKLWELRDGGWMIHDFTDPAYFPTDETRAARREAGRAGGLASGEARRKLSASQSKQSASSTKQVASDSKQTRSTDRSNPEANAGLGKGSRDTEGDPVAEGGSGGETRTARRLPDDFTVTREMVVWARENVPNVDGRLETQKFKDHWKAASGANARKKDWVAAWRNWMRGADERLARGGSVTRLTPRQDGLLGNGFWEQQVDR